MSELTAKLRARVDEIIAPHIAIYGTDAATVKMARLIVAEAENIDRELADERATTERAAELTAWSVATLQRYARARLMGSDALPRAWAGLEVEDTPMGYSFKLSTIPAKLRASA